MNLVPFKYAELCNTSSRWYVYYYAINPETKTLQRIRQYINSQKTIALRKKLAQHLIRIINNKLDQGWNPFISDSQKRMFTPLLEALEDTLAYKARYVRKRSLPQYQTRMHKLIEWIKLCGHKEIRCGDFTETMAQDYMSYLLKQENTIGNCTYNNYLTDYKTIWNYLVKTKHCNVNVFQAVDKLPETDKRKRPFTMDEQIKYRKYLQYYDHPFLVTSMLCYYCGLRPNEITQLKVSDVNKIRQCINVDPSVSKNKKQRIIPVADSFWPLLENFIDKQPGNAYLVSKGFSPGHIKINPVRIAEHFRKIADNLKFDNDLKFYSLKDTCADNLDQSGVSTKTIRDLFGHSNMAITDAYMKGINTRGLDQLRTSFPEFGAG